MPKDPGGQIEESADQPLSRFIAKMETGVSTFAYFAPLRNRNIAKRTVRLPPIRNKEGREVPRRVTYLAHPERGMPAVSDLDFFLAFLTIVDEHKHANGGVLRNPIGFRPTEILKRLGMETSENGKGYILLKEWLERLKRTSIVSMNAVYLADTDEFLSDEFNLFASIRHRGRGEPLPATMHYVWLNDWQLRNLNRHHVVSIPLEPYCRLQTLIARALVPLLYSWFFASQAEGRFEKLYTELCELLGIRPYTYYSEIVRKHGPAFDDLKAAGYLKDWALEKTKDRKNYKVVLHHGENFPWVARRKALEAAPTPAENPAPIPTRPPVAEPEQAIDPTLAAELEKRGIRLTKRVRELVLSHPLGEVLDRLEWGDHLIQKNPKDNPPGFYISLLENAVVPENFETTRKRQLWEEQARALREKQEAQEKLLEEYHEDLRNRVNDHITKNLSVDEHTRLLEEMTQRVRRDHKNARYWAPEVVTKAAEGLVRNEIEKRLRLPTFHEWLRESGLSSAGDLRSRLSTPQGRVGTR